MERQQISAARQQLERLPRRHPIASLSGTSGSTGGTASSANGITATLSGNTFLQALTQQQQVNGGSAVASAGNGVTISNFSNIPIPASSSSSGGGGLTGGVSVGGVNGGGAASGGGVGTASAIGGNGVSAAGGTGLSGTGGVVVVGNTVNGGSVLANGQPAGGQATNQSQFLLARLLTTPLDEKAQAALEVERADR